MTPEDMPVANVRKGKIMLGSVWLVKRCHPRPRDHFRIPAANTPFARQCENQQPIPRSVRAPRIALPETRFVGHEVIDILMRRGNGRGGDFGHFWQDMTCLWQLKTFLVLHASLGCVP